MDNQVNTDLIFVHFVIIAAVGISEFALNYQSNSSDGNDISEKKKWIKIDLE